MIGWTMHTNGTYQMSHGNHLLTVGRTVHGWGYKWKCGYTFTVREGSGFKDLATCVMKLWEDIFEMQNHYMELIRFQARALLMPADATVSELLAEAA